MSAQELQELEERVRKLGRREQFELARRLMTHLEESDPEFRQERLQESAKLVREWMENPAPVDEEAWAEFERLLRERRVGFSIGPCAHDDGGRPC